MKSITKLLPGAQAYENLTYPIGAGEVAELDGLILFDRYLLLLEAKAGEFGSARRGGKEAIKKGLAQLVGDPLEQGARAWDYIRKMERPVFQAKSGQEVILDKQRYTEIAIITLTLDSLDVFTPQMHHLREAGVLGHHDIPWAVCLTDLIVISEILQSPSEFLHFLHWRRAVGRTENVSSGTDELNWLAIYLKEGPKLLAVPEGYTNMAFTSYTDELDAYFLYKGGFRTKPANRPEQPVPKILRALLTATENSGIPAFTTVTEALLDFDFKEREELSQKLRQASRQAPDRSEVIKLDTANLSVRIIRGQRTQEELQQMTKNSYSQGKRTILIAMDFLPEMRVFRCAVQESKA